MGRIERLLLAMTFALVSVVAWVGCAETSSSAGLSLLLFFTGLFSGVVAFSALTKDESKYTPYSQSSNKSEHGRYHENYRNDSNDGGSWGYGNTIHQEWIARRDYNFQQQELQRNSEWQNRNQE
jgi:hypothetical protein